MGKKIAILGFGREGKSVLRFLQKSLGIKKSEVAILDKKTNKRYLSGLDGYYMVFRSPGVPYSSPEIIKAAKKGVIFSSATKLFFENFKGKIIGITGTKGKGTTSTLLYDIMRSAGKSVFLGGNIGKPVLDFIDKNKRYDWAILEMSSFQLQDLTQSPEVAVILDVFPDHQDAHKSLGEYYAAKANIGKYQKKSDFIFFFADNANSSKLAKKSSAKKIAVDQNKFRLFTANDIKTPGKHNFKNSVMAASVALSLGIDPKIVKKEAARFRGMEHRLEFVRKIKNCDFFNDSASTNPHTTAAAINAFPGENKILIAGGRDKVSDYSPILRALKSNLVQMVILFGENKKELGRAVGKITKVKIANNLKAAVKMAFTEAERGRKKTHVVFSPGAASFDMFKDYADRGNKFKKFVRAL